MKNINVKSITICGLSIALVCLTTMFIQIPIPLGYMHLGNSCILLCSIFFGRKNGLLAGGIGSALADLLTGFVIWAIPTLIIKSIMGWVVASIARDEEGHFKLNSSRTIIASITAMIIMVGGYFIGGSILYGNIVAGAAQIPGLALEGIIGIILFYVVGFGFEAAKVPKYLPIHHR